MTPAGGRETRIVRCPGCRRYDRVASAPPSPGARLRCTKCGEVFALGIKKRLAHLEETLLRSQTKDAVIRDIKYLLRRVETAESAAKSYGALVKSIRESLNVLLFDTVGQDLRKFIQEEMELTFEGKLRG